MTDVFGSMVHAVTSFPVRANPRRGFQQGVREKGKEASARVCSMALKDTKTGIEYKSQRHAKLELHVSRETIIKWIESGRFKNIQSSFE